MHERANLLLAQCGGSTLITILLCIRVVAVLIALPPLYIWVPPSILHAKLHMHRLMAEDELICCLMSHARSVAALNLAVDGPIPLSS